MEEERGFLYREKKERVEGCLTHKPKGRVQNMKTAIIGLANSGKTTIFNALTGLNIEVTTFATLSGEPHTGVVRVPDERLKRLTEIYKPKKTTQATVEYIDYLGLTKGDMAQNRKVFDLIRDVDAIVHVVRGFADESIVHPMGSVDPRRDAETIELEMIFGDLELVDKRLERMEEGAKRGKKPGEEEQKLLIRCKEALENETALRDLDFSEEEQKAMRSLQFMSIKPQLIVLNVAEEEMDTAGTKAATDELRSFFKGRQVRVLNLCGKIEMEIAQLSADEALFCRLLAAQVWPVFTEHDFDGSYPNGIDLRNVHSAHPIPSLPPRFFSALADGVGLVGLHAAGAVCPVRSWSIISAPVSAGSPARRR